MTDDAKLGAAPKPVKAAQQQFNRESAAAQKDVLGMGLFA
jgi:hypothetical protein